MLQVLNTFKTLSNTEIPKLKPVTPSMYPKNYLDGMCICRKGGGVNAARKGEGFNNDSDNDDDSFDSDRDPDFGNTEKCSEGARPVDERDEIIERLVRQVERLEVLAEAKNEAKMCKREEKKQADDMRRLIARGKRIKRDAKRKEFATTLALSGVEGGVKATKRFEKLVRDTDHIQNRYMGTTMSSYSKGRFKL